RGNPGHRRPAREPAHADGGAIVARAPGARAVVAVQSGLRPAGIADPAGEDRSQRAAQRRHHAWNAGARNGEQVKRLALLAAIIIVALAAAPTAQGTF